MDPMENENESANMIRDQLLLIFATKGCTYLIYNFVMVLRYVVFHGYFPFGRFYLHPYCIMYYLFACALFFLPHGISRLCARFTGCMTGAVLIYAFVMQHMSDYYVITHDVVTDYAMPFAIFTAIAVLCFCLLRKEVAGYLAMTSMFILISFLVEYISLNFLNQRIIMLLPDIIFFNLLEFVLQAVLISIGYLLAILYTGEESGI